MHNQLQSLYSQAVDAYNAGQWQAALDGAKRCLSIDPENADLMYFRGGVALARGDAADAERWVSKAIERSRNPAFYNTLSVAQARLGEFGRAAESARAGLQCAEQWRSKVDTSILLYNLGRALHLDDRREEAAAVYREVLALDPNHGQAHGNLGSVLIALDDLDGGIAHLRRALELDAGNLQTQSNLGDALLAAGSYKEAWPYFEQRFYHFGRPFPNIGPPVLPIPLWKGESTRAEERLLILNEQELGDSLQFCRYIPMAAQRFSKVAYVAPAPLRRLLEHSFGSLRNVVLLDIDSEVALRDWDRYCLLLSLPMAFDTEVQTIPPTPYLHAEHRAVEKWSTRLAGLGDSSLPRIGLVWAGGKRFPKLYAVRSLPTAMIDALISWPHARWISLQKPDDDSKKLLPHQRAHIVDWMDEVEDFADTAALIASLDLVISVDTSVAHLAGAMGKRVWLLNRKASCWRWMRDREDSPWYPNMRIFTQREFGDWNEVLERVLVELEGKPFETSRQ